MRLLFFAHKDSSVWPQLYGGIFVCDVFCIVPEPSGLLSPCRGIGVGHKGIGLNGHITAVGNTLKQVPPLGTGSGPAGRQLVKVAHISRQLAVFRHDVITAPQVGQINAVSSRTDGELSCGPDGGGGTLSVGEEADQQLGGIDLRLITVIEHTKAPGKRLSPVSEGKDMNSMV